MAEIVQAGQTFEIKGDQPTPQEQVAIDTFLQARNLDDEKTGIQDIDDGQIFITPETKELPNIRIVFWSKDILLINKLKTCLTNRDEIKEYL